MSDATLTTPATCEHPFKGVVALVDDAPTRLFDEAIAALMELGANHFISTPLTLENGKKIIRIDGYLK